MSTTTCQTCTAPASSTLTTQCVPVSSSMATTALVCTEYVTRECAVTLRSIRAVSHTLMTPSRAAETKNRWSIGTASATIGAACSAKYAISVPCGRAAELLGPRGGPGAPTGAAVLGAIVAWWDMRASPPGPRARSSFS